jgi:hypothetical protein
MLCQQGLAVWSFTFAITFLLLGKVRVEILIVASRIRIKQRPALNLGVGKIG